MSLHMHLAVVSKQAQRGDPGAFQGTAPIGEQRSLLAESLIQRHLSDAPNGVTPGLRNAGRMTFSLDPSIAILVYLKQSLNLADHGVDGSR